MTARSLRFLTLAFLAASISAVSAPRALLAQQDSDDGASIAVDPDLAADGQALFRQKGCVACHTIGRGKTAGPDLLGVTERRDLDWIEKFMVDTSGMLSSDPIAQELLEEYDYVRMPNLKLTDHEVQALIHYLARETDRLGNGEKP